MYNSSVKARKKRPRVIPPVGSDKFLLGTFLVSVFLVCLFIVLAPLTLEDPLEFSVAEQSVANQLKRKVVAATDENYFLKHSSPYHTVFSTGCSVFQDWQSYVFFYHWLHSGQEGHTTRISSGCNPDDERKLRSIFRDEIESMNPGKHHLHLTPDYSKVPKKQQRPYKYFNKPFGVKHWMEHALGYPDNHELHDDSIIILMDPDQILLRPFTNDFTNSSEVWKLKEPKLQLKVEHGRPFAQQYGYGIKWLYGGPRSGQINSTYVFEDGKLPTPVSNLKKQDVKDYYNSMGPPYIATAKDMWAIVNVWSEIAPKVHDEYSELLAEMFAYNFAVAHLQLRHMISYSFMTSDPTAGGEGWPLVDEVKEGDVCHNFPESELPHVLHYCQKYAVGSSELDEWWFVGKYRLPKDFISCKSPMLKVPPNDLGNFAKYNEAKFPGNKAIIKEYKSKQAKRETFMLCTMIRALNEAAKFYKDHHCPERSGNYDHSLTFF